MVDKSKVRLLNTKNYDVIKERCIHHMIILTLLPLAHANVEINENEMNRALGHFCAHIG